MTPLTSHDHAVVFALTQPSSIHPNLQQQRHAGLWGAAFLCFLPSLQQQSPGSSPRRHPQAVKTTTKQCSFGIFFSLFCFRSFSDFKTCKYEARVNDSTVIKYETFQLVPIRLGRYPLCSQSIPKSAAKQSPALGKAAFLEGLMCLVKTPASFR